MTVRLNLIILLLVSLAAGGAFASEEINHTEAIRLAEAFVAARGDTNATAGAALDVLNGASEEKSPPDPRRKARLAELYPKAYGYRRKGEGKLSRWEVLFPFKPRYRNSLGFGRAIQMDWQGRNLTMIFHPTKSDGFTRVGAE